MLQSIKIGASRQIFLLQEEDEVHQPGDVCQHGCTLHVPLVVHHHYDYLESRNIFHSHLGVWDEIVASLTAGVAAPHLNVLHGEVPQGQVVSEHVQLGQHGCS